MPFIGNTPDVNFTSFAKQDLTGVTGSPAKRGYTLTHAVANANEIEVFVNNVRQEPTEAYTVNGTGLTMTGDVETTDDFYIIYLGKAIQTTVPPDGSVSTAKIADSAVTNAKINNSTIDLTSKVTGVLPVANGGTGYTNNLAWHFTVGTGANSATYTATIVDFNYIQLDTHNIFSTSTNKITIPRTGLYFMTYGGIKGNNTGQAGRMQILKNNSVIGTEARGEENSPYAQMFGAFSALLSQGDLLHARIYDAGMWTGGTNQLGGNDPHWSGYYIGA